jgi:predicted DCC family thiol-disulfide oxidoreductase YuxK
MKTLHVLYDSECTMCRSLRGWLKQQAAFVPLIFIPLQEPYLEVRFPGIGRMRPNEELVVIADSGEVWRGINAWIIVLWALVDYRTWALRLANPLLKPFARQVCHGISKNRKRLSAWLFQRSPETTGKIPAPPECADGTCRTIYKHESVRV